MRRLVNILDANRVVISDDLVRNMCRNIHSAIVRRHGSTYVRAIVGVARGGLVPATILAHLFEVRSFGMIEAITYDSDDQPLPKDKISLRLDEYTLGLLRKTQTLLVDDIYDSGRTMSLVGQFSPLCLKACLVVKGLPEDRGLTSSSFFHGGLVRIDEWAVFPWEIN